MVSMGLDTEQASFVARRQEMVRAQLRARGVTDVRVLDVMESVPRHEFVAAGYHEQAYEDHPVPIGEGQTLSQPFIVALMLEGLSLQAEDVVLEIGTGSGYLSALLSGLVNHVYSMERLPDLAHTAEATLARLGYLNVTVVTGDGSLGLPDKAPFDAIIVSAAAPQIPKALGEQLREGGRMVIPVGPTEAQELQLVRKEGGELVTKRVEGCRFVPLIGEEAYPPGW